MHDPKVIPLRAATSSAPPVSDEALIVACGMRDESALVQLFERHKTIVHRFLSRMLPHAPDQVEDLVQSTFLEVWRCAPRFRSESSGRTFIIGIACNLARMNRRREARRFRAMDSLASEPTPRRITPEDRAAVNQRMQRLEQAVEDLSPKLRAVLVLCDLEGLTGAEAAAVLKIRPGAVWRRLHDARKRVRAALKEGDR